jgi:hypothetical protein
MNPPKAQTAMFIGLIIVLFFYGTSLRDLRADNCAFLTWSRNRSSSRIRILRLVIVSLTTERRCSKILL